MDQKALRSREVVEKAWQFAPPRGNDLQNAISLCEKAIEIDARNVLAYHCLARMYVRYINDLERAEYYCRKGFEVVDIPREIRTPAIGVDDIRAEVADDFNYLMMIVRLKQRNYDEAKKYLAYMESFFERHSKGKYNSAQREYDDNQVG